MKTIYNMIVCLLAVCLFSCQQDDMDSLQGTGYLRLDVSESRDANTRAAYNPEQLHVQITDENKKVVEETDDYSEWQGKIIELPAGKYTIKAFSNAYDNERGFDKAYYYGSQQATVEAGKEATAKVTCKLANVKVSVKYDEAFLTAFEGRTIAVEVGSTKEGSGISPLSFTTEEKRSAYFPVTDLYAKISINNPNNPQQPFTLEKTFEGVKARDHYILNYKLTDKGNSNISVTVDPTNNEYTYDFEINMTESALTADFVPANAWAKLAYLSASNVQSSKGELVPANVTFKYRKQGDTEWSDATTANQEGTYTATLTGLDGQTTYEYCLADGENMTPVQTLTTEEAVVLQNGSFDAWCDIDIKGLFGNVKTAYPNASADIKFWDTSNTGANTMNRQDPTSGVTSPVHTNGGKAAQLESKYIVIAFAAASLYTGTFGAADMATQTATINFGQPFTERPIALSGFYKYIPASIDNVGKNLPPNTVKAGDPDQCSIYIALAKKSYLVDNGKPETFIDFKGDDNIIAYGELPSGAATEGDNYTEFTIPLKYKEHLLNEKPTHIIIVCSASKYGDYMTGGAGSKLYVDDFSLSYEGEPTLWK